MSRASVNVTTSDLDALRRIAAARRELDEIAAVLLNSKTSKRAQRHELGARLNAVKASLGTVERIVGESASGS